MTTMHVILLDFNVNITLDNWVSVSLTRMSKRKTK